MTSKFQSQEQGCGDRNDQDTEGYFQDFLCPSCQGTSLRQSPLDQFCGQGHSAHEGPGVFLSIRCPGATSARKTSKAPICGESLSARCGSQAASKTPLWLLGCGFQQSCPSKVPAPPGLGTARKVGGSHQATVPGDTRGLQCGKEPWSAVGIPGHCSVGLSPLPHPLFMGCCCLGGILQGVSPMGAESDTFSGYVLAFCFSSAAYSPTSSSLSSHHPLHPPHTIPVWPQSPQAGF